MLLARRIGEPFRVEERRHRRRLRLEQGEVGEALNPRLEGVHDVEPAALESRAQARPHADGELDARARRDGDGGRQRDDGVVEPSALQCAPTGDEVACPCRGREHRHHVTAASERRRDAVDVVVDLVRLRPGERRDETDAHAQTGHGVYGQPGRRSGR